MKENRYRLIIFHSSCYFVVTTDVYFHITMSIYMPDVDLRNFAKIEERDTLGVQNVHYGARGARLKFKGKSDLGASAGL
jgi:hypothetical protein